MGHIFDVRKIVQIFGICVVVIVVLALFAGFLPEGDSYNDPFKIDRSPTTKSVILWILFEAASANGAAVSLRTGRATLTASSHRKRSTYPRS